MLVVGLGGTLFALFLITLLIQALTKIFPPPPHQRTTKGKE